MAKIKALYSSLHTFWLFMVGQGDKVTGATLAPQKVKKAITWQDSLNQLAEINI